MFKNRTVNSFLLIFTHEYPPFAGGISTFTYEYALHLYRLGRKVVVLAPKYGSKDRDFDKKQIFPTVRMRLLKNRGSYFNHIIDVFYLIYVLLIYKIDKIFLTDFFPQRTIALFNLFSWSKFIIAAHGSEILNNLDHPIKRFLFKKIYEKPEAIICVSNYTKKLLMAQNIEKVSSNIRVIYNGVNFDFLTRPSDPKIVSTIKERFNLSGKKVIISLCRLSPRKGIDYVIKAMDYMRERLPDLVYLICGTGESSEYLTNLARELKVLDRVIFAGYVPEENKIEYLDIGDVYIMLSQQDHNNVEGFGISYLEAAARKIPVIGYKHGGVEEAIINNKTGIILDKLSPQVIEEVVEKLLYDTRFRERLIRQGLERCKNELNWSILISKNYDLFDNGFYRKTN